MTSAADELRDARGGHARRLQPPTSFATAPSPAMPCSIRRGESPELLLHPTDTRTGLRYSLLPMTRAHHRAGCSPTEQAQHHLA